MAAARIVEKAIQPPGRCLVSGDFDGPFIDTGSWANQIDPYIYLHVPVVEFWARELLGMVPRAEVEELRERIVSYASRIAELEGFVEAHEQFVAAAEALAADPDTEPRAKPEAVAA